NKTTYINPNYDLQYKVTQNSRIILNWTNVGTNGINVAGSNVLNNQIVPGTYLTDSGEGYALSGTAGFFLRTNGQDLQYKVTQNSRIILNWTNVGTNGTNVAGSNVLNNQIVPGTYLTDSGEGYSLSGTAGFFLRMNGQGLQYKVTQNSRIILNWTNVGTNGINVAGSNVLNNQIVPGTYLTDSGEGYSLSGTAGFFLRTNATCSNGEILENNQCKRIETIIACPDGYVETSGAEVTKGECKGNIDYSYYEYKCNEDKNGQNNNYQIINSGGDCNKIDTNNKTINPELSNSCNSSTPPKNNCKREGFKCNSNERKAVYVENEWRCSPYLCNGDMRCGYGSCENGTEASKDKYQDVAYNPLKQLYAKQCNSALCDYVENRDISYCERKSCPEGEDIISQDGRCYKIECPKGTYLSGTKCLKSDF
ncbi:hypothetical protein ACOTVS_11795, partial [Aliarcobacter butzleri]